MKKYQHLFFDLDHTIWDFDTNASIILKKLHAECGEKLEEVPFLQFFEAYTRYNEAHWKLYRENKISQAELRTGRFKSALDEFGIHDHAILEFFASEYPKQAPWQTNLFPHSIDVLNYLQSKYELHLITNGFEEVQHIKLDNSGLRPFFKTMTTSNRAGVKKPNPAIFEIALSDASARREESIMIGDSIEADCLGARDFGMDQIFFNPKKKDCKFEFTAHIHCLSELKLIL